MARTKKTQQRWEYVEKRHAASLSFRQLAECELKYGKKDAVTGMVTFVRLVVTAGSYAEASAQFVELGWENGSINEIA